MNTKDSAGNAEFKPKKANKLLWKAIVPDQSKARQMFPWEAFVLPTFSRLVLIFNIG